jgi:hypothetical protein
MFMNYSGLAFACSGWSGYHLEDWDSDNQDSLVC